MGKYDIGLSGSSAATASNSSALDARGGGGGNTYFYSPGQKLPATTASMVPWIVAGAVTLAATILFLFIRR